MKKLLVLLVLLLSSGTVLSGGLKIGAGTLTGAGWTITDDTTNWRNYSTTIPLLERERNDPDNSSHYIVGYDTIVDTVTYTVYTPITAIDTVISPRWAPLVTVKLDSVMYRKLIEMLTLKQRDIRWDIITTQGVGTSMTKKAGD